jgi:GMP synthase (glutamine-hydrolysing)
VGSNILGAQFHPEVSPVAGIEPWLVGHAVELSSAGIDPRALRDGAKHYFGRFLETGAFFGFPRESLRDS